LAKVNYDIVLFDTPGGATMQTHAETEQYGNYYCAVAVYPQNYVINLEVK